MMLGAQTYTVRTYTQNERDFRETMKRIAAIGYECVQLSAIGSVPVRAQRDICDEYGLKIALTHTNPDRMIDDTEGVIRDHEILGCDYIGIGMMAPKYQTAEWIDQFAKDFLTPAKKMRDAGKRLMYHNHNIEWTRLRDGRRIMDVLLEQMPAELMGFTLDTYWVQAAGADVLTWIDRLQDRIPCVHLKDMAVQGFDQKLAPVGEGNLDFPKILARLKALGKTEFLLVEQDDCYGESPFDCLRRSYENIRGMGY